MMRSAHLWHVLVAICLMVTTMGCVSIVGDSCTEDADCGTGLVCDASQPDGYCTRSSCKYDGCPDDGLCIAFNEDTSACVKPCLEDEDCRPEYMCVSVFGSHAFCGVSQ